MVTAHEVALKLEEEIEWLHNHVPKPDLEFDMGTRFFKGQGMDKVRCRAKVIAPFSNLSTVRF